MDPTPRHRTPSTADELMAALAPEHVEAARRLYESNLENLPDYPFGEELLVVARFGPSSAGEIPKAR